MTALRPIGRYGNVKADDVGVEKDSGVSPREKRGAGL